MFFKRSEPYLYSERISVPQHSKYLHYTTNNTVEGTQWHFIPEVNVPLIADMSSDIFSREISLLKIFIHLCRRSKKCRCSWCNDSCYKERYVGKIKARNSSYNGLSKHIEANSLLNTPPVFAIYVSMLTLRWIKKEGGLE